MPIFKKLKLVVTLLLILPGLAILVKNSNAETAGHVVISEIQISGASATDEFVEIFNPTSNSINMDGWKLTKKISTGIESNLVSSLSGTINPHGYFLIGHPTGYAGSTTLDQNYSSTSYSITSNNTVLLYSDNQTTLIDKVGMGTAIDYENATTVVPAATKSVARINNQDTDNNLNDFELLEVPDPKNSSFTENTPSPTLTPEPSGSGQATPTAIPTEIPTPTMTNTPAATPTETPMPTPSPTLDPTLSPTPVPTEAPVVTPTPQPTDAGGQATPTFTPNPTSTPTTPKGWLRSPVFTCTNTHIPNFVYTLLKFLMPQRFRC